MQVTMMPSLYLLGILSVLIYFTAAFENDRDALCSDITCEDYECANTDQCEYGKVPDVCECCYTCAKGPGENCGGMYNLAGTCAWGYSCQPHPKYSQMPGICVTY